MPRLILLLAIAVVLYIMYRRVLTVPPHRRRAEYIKLGLAIVIMRLANGHLPPAACHRQAESDHGRNDASHVATFYLLPATCYLPRSAVMRSQTILSQRRRKPY